MSKKPLLSEGTARRWAKYAGIQNESKALIEGMYKEEALEEELEENLEEELEENLEEDDHVKEEALEEADVLAELEEMLDEAGHEGDDMDPMGDEDADEPDPAADDDALDLDAEEAEADDAAMMSQADVEAAVKAGLEAMAAALGDALKVKIDVRAGDDDMDVEDEEVLDEDGHKEKKEEAMDYMEEDYMEEGHGMGKMPHGGMEEGLDRDELVEAVMKRVVARLVKESKED